MTGLLLQGLNLTALGMGVVFTLLTLLVGIVRAMSALCHRIGGEAAPAAAPAAVPTGAAADAELVGVVTAAIAAHRSRQSQAGR